MSNDNTKHNPEAADSVLEPEVIETELEQDLQAGSEAAAKGESVEDLGDASDAVTTLLNQIAQLQAQVQEERARALRAVADLENFRKRLLRDKEEIRRKATSDIVEDLLPALDNFQIGLQHAEKAQNGADVAKGFEFIVAQVNQILSGHGLTRVSPAIGDAFDHNIHEAVGHEASESIADHHVLRVMRVGYSLNDRLLRPASVVVSSGPAAAEGANG